MCHHLEPIDELTEEERTEIRSEHTVDELREAYSEDDLHRLGVQA